MKAKLFLTKLTTPKRQGGRVRMTWAASLLALLVLLRLPAVGQAQEYYHWTTNNGTITIIGYYGPEGAAIIPATITGLPVTSIGPAAFQFWAGLSSVTIPDSVTTIGDSAFYTCSGLTNVTIGNNVTNIGGQAFCACTSLTNLTIPSSVTSIGHSAFNTCTSLSSVTIPDSVTSIGSYAFDACSSLASVTIGNCVISIGDAAFYHCTSLTNVTIPNSVTNIAPATFQYCDHLSSITIPSSVTSIGDHAFASTLLSSVTIPNSVTSIEDNAFYLCASLTSVYFKGNAPYVVLNSFYNDYNATGYYLAGTTGWYSPFGSLTMMLWNPQVQTGGPSFGVRTNRFGFPITGTSDLVIVVEASATLANPAWSPVGTNTLTGGTSYFSDPQWMNYPSRFYRLRMP